MIVSLPYPHKYLWPNGRPHWGAKAHQTKLHKRWAWELAIGVKGLTLTDGAIPIAITVYPMPRGPHPDADGCVSACKAYLDGIALRIGVNDRHFAAPTVAFSERRLGRFMIEVGLP